MKIGKRMHMLRKERDITLDELSKKSGIALATLSRIENDKMTGTLNSHIKICKTLGVSIVELYHELEDESKTVEKISMKTRVEHLISANKAKYELLVTKIDSKHLIPMILTIDSGGSTQKEQNSAGTEKFIYIIAGTIEAVISTETYSLKRGDSLYFDASLPHQFINNTKTVAETLYITAPLVI